MSVKPWRVVYAFGEGPPKTEGFARQHEARLRFQALMRTNAITHTSPRLSLLRTETLEADGWRVSSTFETDKSTRATNGQVSPTDRREWMARHMGADAIYRLPAARRWWVSQRLAVLRTGRRRGSSAAVRR